MAADSSIVDEYEKTWEVSDFLAGGDTADVRICSPDIAALLDVIVGSDPDTASAINEAMNFDARNAHGALDEILFAETVAARSGRVARTARRFALAERFHNRAVGFALVGERVEAALADDIKERDDNELCYSSNTNG